MSKGADVEDLQLEVMGLTEKIAKIEQTSANIVTTLNKLAQMVQAPQKQPVSGGNVGGEMDLFGKFMDMQTKVLDHSAKLRNNIIDELGISEKFAPDDDEGGNDNSLAGTLKELNEAARTFIPQPGQGQAPAGPPGPEQAPAGPPGPIEIAPSPPGPPLPPGANTVAKVIMPVPDPEPAPEPKKDVKADVKEEIKEPAKK